MSLFSPLFHDVLFPPALSRRAKRGYASETSTFPGASSGELRLIYAGPPAPLLYDGRFMCKTRAEAEQVTAFFGARGGGAYGFRWRDPDFYKADNEPLGTGDGVTTVFDLYVTLQPTGGGDGGADPLRQRIMKPVAGSAVIRVNGTPSAGAAVNPEDGTVTFAAPPALGAVLTAQCLYDIPVRFLNETLTPAARPPHAFSALSLIELQR